VRELGGQQAADRDVRPERAPQLFRENAASAESVPGHLVPSQQGEGTLHGLVQVSKPVRAIHVRGNSRSERHGHARPSPFHTPRAAAGVFRLVVNIRVCRLCF